MLSTLITGNSANRAAYVAENSSLSVNMVPADLPSTGTENRYRYYNKVFGSTGADSGTLNMNVDGSSTNQEFFITSDSDHDIYLQCLVITLSDSTVALSKFGALSALTNGIQLEVIENSCTTVILDSVKTGGALIAQSGITNVFGNKGTVSEVEETATEDSNIVAIPLGIIPGGLRIGNGTSTKIKFIVRDDLTGLTKLECRALGYTHHAIGD